jgi:hypothetical protein
MLVKALHQHLTQRNNLRSDTRQCNAKSTWQHPLNSSDSEAVCKSTHEEKFNEHNYPKFLRILIFLYSFLVSTDFLVTVIINHASVFVMQFRAKQSVTSPCCCTPTSRWQAEPTRQRPFGLYLASISLPPSLSTNLHKEFFTYMHFLMFIQEPIIEQSQSSVPPAIKPNQPDSPL